MADRGQHVVERLVRRGARSARRWWPRAAGGAARASSTSAWLRCSSSRRPWRWSSTCSAAGEEVRQPLEDARAASSAAVAGVERARHRPLVAAGQDVQPRGVRVDLVPASRTPRPSACPRAAAVSSLQRFRYPSRLSASSVKRAGVSGTGSETPPARAPPPRVVLPVPETRAPEIGISLPVPEIETSAPTSGLRPARLRGLVEAGGAVDAVAVDEGDGGQVELGGARDQVLGERSAVEERERRGAAQLGVGEPGASACRAGSRARAAAPCGRRATGRGGRRRGCAPVGRGTRPLPQAKA